MKLGEMRKAIGLNQSELAALSGVNLRSLQDYEQGHKSLLSAKVETLLQLSKVLGCSVEDILSDYILKVEDEDVSKERMIKRMLAYKNALDKRKSHEVHFPVITPCDSVDMTRIYPTKQKMVVQVLDSLKDDTRVSQLRLFGSSITMACHKDSDIDLAVGITEPSRDVMNSVSEKIQLACDWNADIIWLNRISTTDRIYNDIMNGVILI